MTAITTAPVRTIDSGLRQDLRGVKVVWQRELIRFRQDRLRAVAALVQPVLFLFVLGTGLSSLTVRLDRWRRPEDVHVPRRAGDVGAVHGDVLGGVDRVGPRVRVPPRDARGTDPARLDPRRQGVRRRHRRHRRRA